MEDPGREPVQAIRKTVFYYAGMSIAGAAALIIIVLGVFSLTGTPTYEKYPIWQYAVLAFCAAGGISALLGIIKVGDMLEKKGHSRVFAVAVCLLLAASVICLVLAFAKPYLYMS